MSLTTSHRHSSDTAQRALRQSVRMVPCPLCNAVAGQKCQRIRADAVVPGSSRSASHQERWDSYRASTAASSAPTRFAATPAVSKPAKKVASSSKGHVGDLPKGWNAVRATGGCTFVEKWGAKGLLERFTFRFDDGDAVRLAELLNRLDKPKPRAK